MPWQRIEPVLVPNARKACLLPYPGHAKGCPNYGKRDTCPPKAPLFEKYIDLQLPVFAVWTVFALSEHIQRMRNRHPEWSYRKLACCLYWQGTARKNLKEEVSRFRLADESHLNMVETYIPEAMAVDVTETMNKIGIVLEWPPVDKVYKIAFLGHAKGI